MTETIRPHLTTLKEIPERISEIIEWSVLRPDDDYVLHFPAPQERIPLRALSSLKVIDGYVAGSAALARLLDILRTAAFRNWKPSDADLFFLNQKVANRVHMDLFDIVQAKEKTVEELLLNLDLPVCRVAHNFADDFWISAQCLAAIYTRRQNVPSYLKDKLSFMSTLEKHMKQNDQAQFIHEGLYIRFVGRIKKYQERGFGVNWIETDKILPWVKNRFHYADWLL